MMPPELPGKDEERPTDELSPQLRRAVQEILDDHLPEDLMHRSIERARLRRPPAQRLRRPRVAVLAALAAAASIAGVLVWLEFRDGSSAQEQIAEDKHPVRQAVPVEEGAGAAETLPTWWAYHQAARRAPEALDALLDAHADRLGASDPESLRIGISPLFAKESSS